MVLLSTPMDISLTPMAMMNLVAITTARIDILRQFNKLKNQGNLITGKKTKKNTQVSTVNVLNIKRE
jgi:hypothetical protein